MAVSCGVGRRRDLDLTLPWLWCRPAAMALIPPPSLGTSICHKYGPKKAKKKEKKREREMPYILTVLFGTELYVSAKNRKTVN